MMKNRRKSPRKQGKLKTQNKQLLQARNRKPKTDDPTTAHNLKLRKSCLSSSRKI
jgi:hypothetical protein